MSNKYSNYSTSDIDILMAEPWEVSDRPYMLHAAYALNCLYDLLDPGDEEEAFDKEDIWGAKVDRRILDRLVVEMKEDFNDAAFNHKPIRIWGRSYSIRKVNSYDKERLNLIFDFPLEDGEYTITKDGIRNLAGATDPALESYEVTKEQAKRNRNYLRQIIKLAEDDANDGWDKLSDMEIVVYCWALFYNKYQSDNFIHFKKEYKDYIYVTEKEIISCLNEKSTLRQSPVGMYAFSYDRVKDWNDKNSQISQADKIPLNEAEDYWYDVALKKTFKPMDL